MPKENFIVNLNDLNIIFNEIFSDFFIPDPLFPSKYITSIGGIKFGFGSKYILNKALNEVKEKYPNNKIEYTNIESKKIPELKDNEIIIRRQGNILEEKIDPEVKPKKRPEFYDGEGKTKASEVASGTLFTNKYMQVDNELRNPISVESGSNFMQELDITTKGASTFKDWVKKVRSKRAVEKKPSRLKNLFEKSPKSCVLSEKQCKLHRGAAFWLKSEDTTISEHLTAEEAEKAKSEVKRLNPDKDVKIVDEGGKYKVVASKESNIKSLISKFRNLIKNKNEFLNEILPVDEELKKLSNIDEDELEEILENTLPDVPDIEVEKKDIPQVDTKITPIVEGKKPSTKQISEEKLEFIKNNIKFYSESNLDLLYKIIVLLKKDKVQLVINSISEYVNEILPLERQIISLFDRIHKLEKEKKEKEQLLGELEVELYSINKKIKEKPEDKSLIESRETILEKQKDEESSLIKTLLDLKYAKEDARKKILESKSLNTKHEAIISEQINQYYTENENERPSVSEQNDIKIKLEDIFRIRAFAAAFKLESLEELRKWAQKPLESPLVESLEEIPTKSSIQVFSGSFLPIIIRKLQGTKVFDDPKIKELFAQESEKEEQKYLEKEKQFVEQILSRIKAEISSKELEGQQKFEIEKEMKNLTKFLMEDFIKTHVKCTFIKDILASIKYYYNNVPVEANTKRFLELQWYQGFQNYRDIYKEHKIALKQLDEYISNIYKLLSGEDISVYEEKRNDEEIVNEIKSRLSRANFTELLKNLDIPLDFDKIDFPEQFFNKLIFALQNPKNFEKTAQINGVNVNVGKALYDLLDGLVKYLDDFSGKSSIISFYKKKKNKLEAVSLLIFNILKEN